MNDQIEPMHDMAVLPEDFIGPPMYVVPFEKPVRRSHKKEPITTLNLTSRTCRWPFGDPVAADFHYCGKPPQGGEPYCDTHAAISRPASQRRVRPLAA